MRVTVQVDGMKDVLADLARLNGDGPKAISAALFKEAEVIANEARRLVPVDTGALRSTIHVEGPKETAAGAEVEIIAGGPAAGYAVYVHEDPTKHHPNGEYKFIEKPVLAEVQNIAAAIREEVSRLTK